MVPIVIRLMVMVMVGLVVIVVTHFIQELCWLLLSILSFRMVVLLLVVVVVIYRHKRFTDTHCLFGV